MNRFTKYLSLLLAILLVAAGTCLVVSAAYEPASYDEPDPGYDPDYTDPVTTEDPVYDPAPYQERWDDPDYVYDGGDGSSSAGSVKDANTLIDIKEIDKNDIKASQWSKITLSEESAKASSSSDNDNFRKSGLKTDDSSEATQDDRGWILWVGIGLIALALLCILYFVIATVKSKKQTERDIRHNSGSHGSGGSGGAGGSRATDRRSSGHYADGYEASTRRGSKADTGEVYVPRRATK